MLAGIHHKGLNVIELTAGRRWTSWRHEHSILLNIKMYKQFKGDIWLVAINSHTQIHDISSLNINHEKRHLVSKIQSNSQDRFFKYLYLLGSADIISGWSGCTMIVAYLLPPCCIWKLVRRCRWHGYIVIIPAGDSCILLYHALMGYIGVQTMYNVTDNIDLR